MIGQEGKSQRLRHACSRLGSLLRLFKSPHLLFVMGTTSLDHFLDADIYVGPPPGEPFAGFRNLALWQQSAHVIPRLGMPVKEPAIIGDPPGELAPVR